MPPWLRRAVVAAGFFFVAIVAVSVAAADAGDWVLLIWSLFALTLALGIWLIRLDSDS